MQAHSARPNKRIDNCSDHLQRRPLDMNRQSRFSFILFLYFIFFGLFYPFPFFFASFSSQPSLFYFLSLVFRLLLFYFSFLFYFWCPSAPYPRPLFLAVPSCTTKPRVKSKANVTIIQSSVSFTGCFAGSYFCIFFSSQRAVTLSLFSR